MFGRTAVTSLDGSALTSPLLLAIAIDGGVDASTEADHAADTTYPSGGGRLDGFRLIAG